MSLPALRLDSRSAVIRWLVAGLLILTALAGIGWRATGGHWYRVETASMGTQAPVGSLLWVRPVNIADLRVGDFISFRQPNNHANTISHRVNTIHPDGTITTKGVISDVDPWRLTQDDLVGRVVAVWWGVGALVEALPIVVVGALLLAALRLQLRPSWRAPVTLVAVALIVVVALIVHRPLVNAQQIANEPTATGARLTFVGTGLLPTRISAPSGESVVVRPGELGIIHVPTSDERGLVQLSLRAQVGWWWFLIITLLCLAPAAAALPRPRRHVTTTDA